MGEFIRPKITDKEKGIYGHVDFINADGIGGWVIDVRSAEPRVVEVYINDEKVGEYLANLPRQDISQILGRDAKCGFYIRWVDVSLPSGLRWDSGLDIAVVDKLSGREIIGKHAKGRKPKVVVKDFAFQNENLIGHDSHSLNLTKGWIDFVSRDGIGGWLIDVGSKEPAVFLIAINDTIIYEGVTNIERTDIKKEYGVTYEAGFKVSWHEVKLPMDILKLPEGTELEISVISKKTGFKLTRKVLKREIIGLDKELVKQIMDNNLFNKEWYLDKYPEVKDTGIDPLIHYIYIGWREGKNPSPNFDTKFYLYSNEDVRLAGVNPLIHYVLYGKYEGRRPKAKEAPDVFFRLSYMQNLNMAQKKTSLEFVPESDIDLSEYIESLPFKLIALYLPQFHPIPENDEWWGKGFTEWTNVTKAVPNFVGHYQPRLPIDLGFYDLRVPEVMRRQVQLAKKYGIYGFCFFVYWFNGKRLLEKPLDAFIEDRDIDFKFCISWANENWTRRWDGLDKEILMPQVHTYESDCRFIHDMVKYLSHRNYLRINGRPIILVYKAHALADPKRTAEYWKNFCVKEGLGEPILVAERTFGFYDDPAKIGFDVALEYPPHLPKELHKSLIRLDEHAIILNPDMQGAIYDYRQICELLLSVNVDYKLIKTVMLGWDNTPRRQNFPTIFIYSSPYYYKKWLSALIKRAKETPYPEEKLIFINAWNEWAEGTYLEPDRKYGYAYLQATAEAILEHLPKDSVKIPNIIMFKKDKRIFYETIDKKIINKTSDIAVIIHLYYKDLWDEFKYYLDNIPVEYDLFISIPVEVYFDTDKIFSFKKNAYIYRNINRGRDVSHFLKIFQSIYPLKYKYGLKLHSKKSPQRAEGDDWRITAIQSLIGNGNIVNKIIDMFEANEKIGLIVPDGYLDSFKRNEGYNRDKIEYLCKKIGVKWEGEDFKFPLGTLFWFRFDALSDILKFNFSLDDFEPEFHQLDGCLHHALERFFGLIVKKRGYLYGVSDGERIEVVEG